MVQRWVTSDDVFADIGGGKGRSSCKRPVAPFKRVIGLEDSEVFAAIA